MGKVNLFLHFHHMECNQIAVVQCIHCGLLFASSHLDYLFITVDPIHARFCANRPTAIEWYTKE